MASYINTMREKQWPEVPHAAPSAPRTEEEKNESRERAHNLISSKCRAPICCLVGFFFLQILYSKSTVWMIFLSVCRFQLPCLEEDRYGVGLQPVSGTWRKQNTGICECLHTWSLLPLSWFLALIFIRWFPDASVIPLEGVSSQRAIPECECCRPSESDQDQLLQLTWKPLIVFFFSKMVHFYPLNMWKYLLKVSDTSPIFVTTSVSMSGTHFSTMYLIRTVNILLFSLCFYLMEMKCLCMCEVNAFFVAAIAKKKTNFVSYFSSSHSHLNINGC